MQTFSTIARNASEAAYPHLWQGLAGAWVPSLGVTGDTLRDVSGRKHHGTLTGMDPSTDWQVSGGGWCLDFDGTNDVVLAPAIPQIAGATQATFSFWSRRNAANATAAIHQVQSTLQTNGRTQIVFFKGTLWLTLSAVGQNNYATYASSDTLWHHVTVIFDGSGAANADKCRLFFDGVPRSLYFVGTMPTSLNAANTLQFGIGAGVSNGYQYANAKHADTLVYDRAITDAEALQLYAMGRGGEALKRKRRRVYSIPGPAFKAAWAARATTIAGVLQ